VRGRFFARRNSWTTLVGMLVVLLYGYILDRWPGSTGFYVLYLIALAAAGLNLYWWFQHPELPQGDQRGNHSFWESVRIPLTRPGPHLRATWFFAAWALAQGMAAPFYSVALVQYLGLSFTVVSWLAALASVTAILTAPLWGRWQDRVGQTQAIGILTAMLAVVPPLYLLGKPLGLAPLILAHVLHGTASAGLGIANQTLNMQLAPKQDRTSYFAFFAAAGGLTGFLTPVLTGPLTSHHLAPLFLCSALLSGALSLLWRVRVEPRLAVEMRSLLSSD
jgi:MFS family permease